MNDRKFSLRSIFYNNKSLFILSILAGVLFWFLVVSNVTPQMDMTFGGVTVQLDNELPNLTSRGLQVISSDRQTVSLEVSGPRSLLGRLSANDFIVSGKLDDISRAGTYSIHLSAALAEPNPQITIKKVSPSHISAYFDRKIAKQMRISVKLDGSHPAEGYITGTPTADPAAVTVIGPEQSLLKLKEAVATFKVSGNATDDVTGESDIVLYTASGPSDMGNITQGALKTNVTVPVLKTKTLMLTMQFYQYPDGFDPSNVAYTFAPETVKVAGKADAIDPLGPTLEVGSASILNLDLTTKKTFPLKPPDGVTFVGDVQSAAVTVQLKNTAKKAFRTSHFAAANLPAGFGADILSESVDNVQVFGPPNEMPSVKDILATVDLGGVRAVGAQTVPVKLSVPGKSGFWIEGIYKARVYIYRR